MTKEQNMILDLLELCKEQFENPMIQPYSGANYECLFCMQTDVKKHLNSCPVMKYKDILERYKK